MTYQQKRARGLCGRCPNPSPDYCLCFACRVKDSARAKRAYARRKVQQARRNVGRAA